MNDFVTPFWAWFVAVATMASIAWCGWLLWATSKTTVSTAEDNTTGHVWDGNLREMNNPLPRWWVGLFIITVIFSLAYVFLYPTLGKTQGQLGWSSTGQHASEVKAYQEKIGPLYAGYAAKAIPELSKDAQAMAVGERLFMNYCAQCHGSDARGGKSFPNLADKDWLGDGTPEYIVATITEGRMGIMPPMGESVGTPEQVENLALYVMSLSGEKVDAGKAAAGKASFEVCAACHGADAKGMAATGAPNLTDNIWLHGYGTEHVVKMINNGMTNVMPAQNKLLTKDQIHVLASYVWGLSNK